MSTTKIGFQQAYSSSFIILLCILCFPCTLQPTCQHCKCHAFQIHHATSSSVQEWRPQALKAQCHIHDVISPSVSLCRFRFGGRRYRYHLNSIYTRIYKSKPTCTFLSATDTQTGSEMGSNNGSTSKSVTKKQRVQTSNKKKSTKKMVLVSSRKKSSTKSKSKVKAGSKQATAVVKGEKKITNRKKKRTSSKSKAKDKKKQTDAIYFWSNKTDHSIIKYPSSLSLMMNRTLYAPIVKGNYSTLLLLQNETATISNHLIEEQSKLDGDLSSPIATTSFEHQTSDKVVHFTVRGNPLPLQRHRTYRNFVYNPSSQKQKQYREIVISMLPTMCFYFNQTASLDWSNATQFYDRQSSSPQKIHFSNLIHHPKDINVDNIQPFFTDNEFIKVKIIFHLKRPKNHFKANIPGHGRIRPKFESIRFQSTRVDVDNLAKFVLDSLNGVLYGDDRQVIELHVMKVFDNEDICAGKTEVWISRMNDI